MLLCVYSQWWLAFEHILCLRTLYEYKNAFSQASYSRVVISTQIETVWQPTVNDLLNCCQLDVHWISAAHMESLFYRLFLCSFNRDIKEVVFSTDSSAQCIRVPLICFGHLESEVLSFGALKSILEYVAFIPWFLSFFYT